MFAPEQQFSVNLTRKHTNHSCSDQMCITLTLVKSISQGPFCQHVVLLCLTAAAGEEVNEEDY